MRASEQYTILQLLIKRVPFLISPSLGYIQLCCIYVVSKRVEALARLRGSLLSPE